MKTLKTLLFVLFVFGIECVNAAPAPPPSAAAAAAAAGTPGCWPPPCVPIDGGIVFLMVAAGLYGAYKLFQRKKAGSTIS